MRNEVRSLQNTLILNNEQMTVFREIKSCLETCNQFYINVAFVNYGGLQLFLKTFDDLRRKDIKGKILTSTYLNFSDPKALIKLNEFSNIDLKVYDDVKNKGFHSKAYIFEYDNYYKVIIGSANMTCSAMKSNIEWNIEVISKKDDSFMLAVMDEFLEIWDKIDIATEDFLLEYEKFIQDIRTRNEQKQNPSFFQYHVAVEPNIMQKRAMDNLAKLRLYGEHKALVIAATGTGKTYMSAFDVFQYKPKKVLFIVHREDILRKAELSYKDVMGDALKTGFLTGREKNYEASYLFTTIQTLSHCFDMYDKDEFDYIVIDEAHHLAGDTYQRVLTYFHPKFLLGMTATPERCDNFDIFDAFDNNVAIEVRLHEAMEEELVVPFHYFGISDLQEIDYENMKMNNPEDIAKKLKLNQRVDYIIEQMRLYGHDGKKCKCLGFCVNIDHAQFMSEEFHKRGIESICLTGNDSVDRRKQYTERLENEQDSLQVIFTIDIFNEGIDIPSINLVLMLRPTNSPIIFIQQLGRGLRKNKGKEYLTVLDFIGNHNRAFLLAVALKGSRYYDKDSLKVAVKNEFVNIPGETFVQLDEMTKERIIQQIEHENFNSLYYLKQEYLSFKSLLYGKTPSFLMDYILYEGAPDPIKFIYSQGSYLGFLTKVEEDECFKDLISDVAYMKYMKYLCDMLPLKRPHDFAIILAAIQDGYPMGIEVCKSHILKYMKQVDTDSVLHAMQTISFQFYDIGQKRRWNPFVCLHEQTITRTKELEGILRNKQEKEYLLDVLRYGLMRYKNEFEETYYGIPFLKLYAQYGMQEIALLSNFRKTHSSFRGSGLLTSGKEYFLFVDLHKDEDIKESINYNDKFLNRKNFQWETPNSTAQNTERGQNIIKNKENGIHLHLFIRKFNKIDNLIQPYIYVGKMNTYAYEGERPIKIHAKLENEVPSDLFNELTCKVDVKKLN